jgi:hypothetical protein
MILPFILTVVALAILFLLLYVEGGRNSSVNSVEDLAVAPGPWTSKHSGTWWMPAKRTSFAPACRGVSFAPCRENAREPQWSILAKAPTCSLSAAAGRGRNP